MILNYIQNRLNDMQMLNDDEKFRFLAVISSNDNIQSLLKEILNSKILLTQVAQKSYQHSNRFDKIVIASNLNGDFRLTLHLWNPPFSDYELSDERIHSHRFDFWSYVLFGNLSGSKFSENINSGQTYFEYRYYPNSISLDSKLVFTRETNLIIDNSFNYSRSESYCEYFKNIHSVKLSDTPTCTFVLRGERMIDYTRVFNKTRFVIEDYSPQAFSEWQLKKKFSFILNNL